MAGAQPAAATFNGPAQSAPYVALVSAQVLTQTNLFAATANSVLEIFGNGTASPNTLAAPGVGTINGLAYDPNSQTLFVSGSLGVVWYNTSAPGPPVALNSSITSSTAIAFDKYNGLIYVAQSDGFVHVYTESGVVAGGKFDLLGGVNPAFLLVAP